MLITRPVGHTQPCLIATSLQSHPQQPWALPALPMPLTAAVAGAAGVLLEVCEQSVAWAAGRGEALTQSLVTHWPKGHKACHLEAGTSHCSLPLPRPWMTILAPVPPSSVLHLPGSLLTRCFSFPGTCPDHQGWERVELCRYVCLRTEPRALD